MNSIWSDPFFFLLNFSLVNDFIGWLQLIFVHVEMDNEDVGKPVSEYFGVSGDDPKVIFSILS